MLTDCRWRTQNFLTSGRKKLFHGFEAFWHVTPETRCAPICCIPLDVIFYDFSLEELTATLKDILDADRTLNNNKTS